jgi:DNA-binding SARP family transcriptional activator
MAGPFRFAPPVLGPDVLTRPRLLRSLVTRFTHRCTLIVGGAGHGKTTLLAQAVAENRLAPRGDDVWFTIEASDSNATLLARDLLEAFDDRWDTPTATTIANAVWRRAPTDVCLLLDDAHELTPDSPGRALIAELFDALPANGHLAIAARTPPSLPYARLASRGELLRLEEKELRFDDEELAAFATTRGVDITELARTGGWPAMAELVASAGVDLAGDFLWQEVLEPIDPAQRRMFAVLCDLGGGDDALLSAALGEPVEIHTSIPLVAVDADGWREPHALWRSVAATETPAVERLDIRRRAARELVARNRLDTAFTLLAGADLWDDVPAVLQAACRAGMRPAATQLRAWLAQCPDHVTQSPAGQLAAGVLAALHAPATAATPLRNAIAGFRAAGDVDGELSAISHLGHVAWWQRDPAALAELAPRVAALEAAGSATASALAAIGRALFCNIDGDDAGVLAALDAVPAGVLDPWWDAVIAWFRGIALHGLGDEPGFFDALEAALPHADPAFRVTVECSLTAGRWGAGHLDSVSAEAAALMTATEATGIAQEIGAIAATATRACAFLGDVETARSYLRRAHTVAAHLAPAGIVHIALAEAALATVEGDEERAATTLRAALAELPIGDRRARSIWRTDVVLTYVLVPEQRAAWDAATGSRQLAWRRDLAAAVVAGREATGVDPIGSIDVSNPALVRAALPFPFAGELAVRLREANRTTAAMSLLESLGEPGRAHVRQLRRNAATALLAIVPAAPAVPVTVRVFGALHVDGRPLERVRVRELLGYLVLNRVTTRAGVCAAIWPDLDDRAAGNNLRVTLSHLLRALEPDRTEGEAAYFVRQHGSTLRLVSDVALDIDLDAFDAELATASAAENDATPSIALEHYLAATALFRGDLLADLPDVPWADIERERCRTRFVAAAVRAGELLVASNDPDRAELLAQRALVVDEWSEPAYTVLAAAALARGDRAASLRILSRCDEMLHELGVEPSEGTRRLVRRARSAPVPTDSAVFAVRPA